MAGEQIPEAWIGWQVTLMHWNGETSSATRCTLEALNDHGIVVSIEETEIQGSSTTFYPWSAVLQMQKV